MQQIETVEQQKQELEKFHRDKIYNYKRILYDYLKDKRRNLSAPSTDPVQDLSFKWQIIMGSKAYFLSGFDATRFKVNEYDTDTNALEEYMASKAFETQYISESQIEKQLIEQTHTTVPVYNKEKFTQLFEQIKKPIKQKEDFNANTNIQLVNNNQDFFYDKDHYETAIAILTARYRQSFNMEYFQENYVEPKQIQEILDQIILSIVKIVREGTQDQKFAWVNNMPVNRLDVNILYARPQEAYSPEFLQYGTSIANNPATFDIGPDYKSMAGFALPYDNFFALARLRVFANKVQNVAEYRNGFYFLQNYADEIAGYTDYSRVSSSSGIEQISQNIFATRQFIKQQFDALQQKFQLNAIQVASASNEAGKNYTAFLESLGKYQGGNIMEFRRFLGMTIEQAAQAILEEEKPPLEIESAAIIYDRQQELLQQQAIKYQSEIETAFRLRVQQQEITLQDAEYLQNDQGNIKSVRVEQQIDIPNLQLAVSMLQKTNYNPYQNIFNLYRDSGSNYSPLIIYSFQEIYQTIEKFQQLILQIRQNFLQDGVRRDVALSDNQMNNVVYTMIQYLAVYYGNDQNPDYVKGAQVIMFIFNDVSKSNGAYTIVNGEVQMNSLTKILMININEILTIYKLLLIMYNKQFDKFASQIKQFTGAQIKEINTQIIIGIQQLYIQYSDVDLPQSMQDTNIIDYNTTNQRLNPQTFDGSIYELLTRMLVQVYINSIKANSKQFSQVSQQSCFQLITSQLKRPYYDPFTYFLDYQKLMYQYIYQNIGNVRNNKEKNQPLSQQLLQASFAQDNYNIYYGTMFYNITTSVGIVAEMNVKILEACVYSKYQYINIASYSELIRTIEQHIIQFLQKTQDYQEMQSQKRLVNMMLFEFTNQIGAINQSLTGQSDENILTKSINVTDVRLINILFMLYYICDMIRVEPNQTDGNYYKLKSVSFLALLTGEISEVSFGNLSKDILNISPVVNPVFNVNMLSTIYAAIDVMYNNQQILNKFGGAFRFVSVGYYLIKSRNTQQTRSIDKILALLYKKDQQSKQLLSNWQNEYTHASYMSALAKYMYFGFNTAESIVAYLQNNDIEDIRQQLIHIQPVYYTNFEGFKQINSISRLNDQTIQTIQLYQQNARKLHGPRYAHFLRAQNNAMAYPKFFVEQILQYYNKTYEDINQSLSVLQNAIPFMESLQQTYIPHTNQLVDFMHKFLVVTRDLLLTESSQNRQNLDVALPPYFFYDFAAINGFRGIRDDFTIENNMNYGQLYGLPRIFPKYYNLVRKISDERPVLMTNEEFNNSDYDEDRLDIFYEAQILTDVQILNMYSFNPYNSLYTDYLFYDEQAKENRYQRSDWPVDDVQKFVNDNMANFQQLQQRFQPRIEYKTLQEIFSGYDNALLYGPTNLMLLIFFAKRIEYFIPDIDETATVYDITKITEDQKNQISRQYNAQTLEDYRLQLQLNAEQAFENNKQISEQEYIATLINNYQLIMLDINQAATNYHIDQLRPRNALERKLNYISNLSMTNYVTYKQKFIKSVLILAKFFPQLYDALLNTDFKVVDKISKYCRFVIITQSGGQQKQVPAPDQLDIPKIDDTILKMAEYEQAQAEKRIAQTVLQRTQAEIKKQPKDQIDALKQSKTDILTFAEIKHSVESANQVFQYLTSYQAAQIYDFIAVFYGYYFRTLILDDQTYNYVLPRFYLTKDFYDVFVKNIEATIKQKLITSYNASYVVISQLQYKLVFDDITTFTKINFFEGSYKPINYVLTKDYLTEFVQQRVQIQAELNQRNAYAKAIDDKLAELQLLQSTAITLVNQMKKITDDITLATSQKKDVKELIDQRLELQTALNQTRQQIDVATREVDTINEKMQALKDYYDMRYSKQAANLFNSELQLNIGKNVKILNKMADTMKRFNEIAAQLVQLTQNMQNYQSLNTLDRARLLKEYAKIANSLRQISKDTEKDLQEASKDVVERQRNINDIQKNGRGNVRQALYSYAVKIFEEKEKTIRDSIILNETNFNFKQLSTQQLQKFVEAQSIRKALYDLPEFTNKYIESNYDNTQDKIIEKLKQANPNSLKNRASFSNTIKLFTQQQNTISLKPEQVDAAIAELRASIKPQELTIQEIEAKADAQTKIQNIINRITAQVQPKDTIDYIIPNIPKPDEYIAQTSYNIDFFRNLYVNDLNEIQAIVKRAYTINNKPFGEEEQKKLEARMAEYNQIGIMKNHIGQRFASLSTVYKNYPGQRAALTNLYIQLFRSGNWDEEVKNMVELALGNDEETKGELSRLYELNQSQLEQLNEDRVKMLLVYNQDGTLNRQLSKLQYIKLLNQWFQFKFQIADQDVLFKTITKIKDTTLGTAKQLVAQITFAIEVDLRTMKDLFVEDFLREQYRNNQNINVFDALNQFKEFMNLRALDIYKESYSDDIQYIFN